MAAQACPCGRLDAKQRVVPFVDCCGRFIDHLGDHIREHAAPDAEHLMRSRYSAFVLGRADYLLQTWHSHTRPATLDLDASAKWLGLEVRDHKVTGADTAEVEFVARCRVGGKATRMHERSRFVREDGRWLYVDGDQHG
jgi:SEC-C motif-containing protein